MLGMGPGGVLPGQGADMAAPRHATGWVLEQASCSVQPAAEHVPWRLQAEVAARPPPRLGPATVACCWCWQQAWPCRGQASAAEARRSATLAAAQAAPWSAAAAA